MNLGAGRLLFVVLATESSVTNKNENKNYVISIISVLFTMRFRVKWTDHCNPPNYDASRVLAHVLQGRG
jgi:hypothetical protein